MDPDLKSALRAKALTARAAVQDRDAAQAEMNAHLSALLATRPGAVVAGYWPMRGEADPRPALLAHGGPVCLPVVVAPATPLIFRRWHTGDALQPGSLGTHHPAESAPVMTPDVVIVPLAGFDHLGARLGYGGGFYDRTLAGLKAGGPVLAVGFAFDAQRIGPIPAEPTDMPLDRIITETGCRSFPLI